MIKYISTSFISFFSRGNERTLLAKKNIFYSLLLKGGSVLISLLIVPISINYVSSSQYGIWVTLSSVIFWFSLFDIGLGNGLKNKLAESNALNIIDRSKIYISTTYAVLIGISAIFFCLFFIGNKFISWQKILNTHDVDSAYLNNIALLLIGLFSIQFVTQIINSILNAFHKPAVVSLITLIGQALSLFAIIYLSHFSVSNSLFNLVFAMAGLPLLAQIVASIFFFSKSLKPFSPSIAHVDLKYTKSLLSVGGKFFVIQIGALILFQTDNIVITQIYGPSEVTQFNIAYKLFAVLVSIFSIVITPYWSAFTDAYAKNDWEWIKGTLAKLRKICIAVSVVSLILILIANNIYRFWLNGKISVPLSLSIAMALYVIAFSWQTMYVYFLNGIGIIKLQLYLVILSSLVNVPLAVFLTKYFGVAGVTYSNTILFAIMTVFFSIQTKKIINHTATGIFYK